MGLFKKNKKEKNEQPEITSQPEKIEQKVETNNQPINPSAERVEVLELNQKDNNESKQEEKMEGTITNTLELKRENRLLFIIIIALILFVIFLPTITRFVNRKSIFSYTNAMEDIVSNETVDGMLEIGKEKGSITVKNIRFYNPSKKGGNEISIVYLPETTIKNVDDMQIYIELYNSNKGVIYREKFTSDNKLERKVQGIMTMKVNGTIYKEASYAKVTIIKDSEFNKSDSTRCTNSFTDENYSVEYKITYNFSIKGLTSYQVNRIYKIEENNSTDSDDNETTGNEQNTTNKYKEMFENEWEEISKTNTKELEYDDDLIKYTIDLKTLELGKSKYQPLYNLGSVKRQITLKEESEGWSCK